MLLSAITNFFLVHEYSPSYKVFERRSSDGGYLSSRPRAIEQHVVPRVIVIQRKKHPPLLTVVKPREDRVHDHNHVRTYPTWYILSQPNRLCNVMCM